jgi:hypothetical protein
LALPAFRECLRVLTRVPEKRKEEDKALLGLLRRFLPIDDLYRLVQGFIRMVRQQEVDLFDPWLEVCAAMPFAACQHFAEGLKQDYQAVRAALILPHSNGQTEGAGEPPQGPKTPDVWTPQTGFIETTRDVLCSLAGNVRMSQFFWG